MYWLLKNVHTFIRLWCSYLTVEIVLHKKYLKRKQFFTRTFVQRYWNIYHTSFWKSTHTDLPYWRRLTAFDGPVWRSCTASFRTPRTPCRWSRTSTVPGTAQWPRAEWKSLPGCGFSDSWRRAYDKMNGIQTDIGG